MFVAHTHLRITHRSARLAPFLLPPFLIELCFCLSTITTTTTTRSKPPRSLSGRPPWCLRTPCSSSAARSPSTTSSGDSPSAPSAGFGSKLLRASGKSPARAHALHAALTSFVCVCVCVCKGGLAVKNSCGEKQSKFYFLPSPSTFFFLPFLLVRLFLLSPIPNCIALAAQGPSARATRPPRRSLTRQDHPAWARYHREHRDRRHYEVADDGRLVRLWRSDRRQFFPLAGALETPRGPVKLHSHAAQQNG